MTLIAKDAYTLMVTRWSNVRMNSAKWLKTTEPISWFGHILPIGTEYKTFADRNFGYVILRSPVGGRKIIRQ